MECIKKEPADSDDDDTTVMETVNIKPEPPEYDLESGNLESEQDFTANLDPGQDFKAGVKVELEEEDGNYEPPQSPQHDYDTMENLSLDCSDIKGDESQGLLVGHRIYTSASNSGSSGPDSDSYQSEDSRKRSKKKKKPKSVFLSNKSKWRFNKTHKFPAMVQDQVTQTTISDEERVELFARTLEDLRNTSSHCCETCALGFQSEKRLQGHNKRMHTEVAGVVKCYICQSRFKKKAPLRRHMRSHFTGFRCKICQQKFYERHEALLHVSATHELRTHHCPIQDCNKKFYRAKELKSHITRHSSPVFKCPLCFVAVNSKGMLHKHINQTHKEPKEVTHTCVHCGVTFTSARELVHHKDRAHPDMRLVDAEFGCDLCDRSFSSRALLNTHIKRMHCGRVKRFQCDHCNAMFYTKPEVRSHILWTHFRALHAGYACACGLVFRAPNRLRAHAARAHAGQVPEKTCFCDLCGKGFESNYLLRRHIKRHLPAENHPCPACDMSFKEKHYVAIHYKVKHLNMTRAQVDQEKCRRRPRTVDDCLELTRSITFEEVKEMTGVEQLIDAVPVVKKKRDSLDEEKKEFPCEQCGKIFKTNSLLRRHSKVHTGVTYPCSACDMRFKDKRYVQVHYQIKHLNMTRADLRKEKDGNVEVKHPCEECGKSFAAKTLLRRHQKIHQGITYPCKECGLSFKDQAYVKVHYKIKHLGIKWDEAKPKKKRNSKNGGENESENPSKSNEVNDEDDLNKGKSNRGNNLKNKASKKSENVKAEIMDLGQSVKIKIEPNDSDDEVEITPSSSSMDGEGIGIASVKIVADYQVPLFDTFAELIG